MPETPEAPLRHGYTLADLEHLTRLTLRMDRWHQATDIDERYDTVRHALIETLLTADEPPSRGQMLRAGTEASDAYVRAEMRTHGRDTSKPGAMPRFHAYWNPANTPSPEPRVVEATALAQIWPMLRPSEQRALAALAATGSYGRAAEVYGAGPKTFRVVVSTGRRRFLELWHEGEAPSRQWRTDRRAGTKSGLDSQGRQRLTVSQVEALRQRRFDGATVKALAAEVGLTTTGLSRLLNGASNAAPDRIGATA